MAKSTEQSRHNSINCHLVCLHCLLQFRARYIFWTLPYHKNMIYQHVKVELRGITLIGIKLSYCSCALHCVSKPYKTENRKRKKYASVCMGLNVRPSCKQTFTIACTVTTIAGIRKQVFFFYFYTL